MPALGRARQFAGRACACLAVAALLPGHACGEVLRGQSRELGIQFEVKGGSDWCRPNPVVRLEAASRAAFRPRDVPFQQMIGRIRAVVTGQCSIIESLSFEGTVKEALAFAAETSKLTRWRHLVVLDPVTRRPVCLFGQEAHADCARRAQAYLVARQALNPIVLADLELTTVLDPRAPIHLGWRSDGVTGKLTIAEGDRLADYYESANALAESYIEELGAGCTDQGGALAEKWLLEGFKEITLGGFECRKGAARETTSVVVAGTPSGFDVFSMASDKAEPESVKSMAWGIALAIKDRGW